MHARIIRTPVAQRKPPVGGWEGVPLRRLVLGTTPFGPACLFLLYLAAVTTWKAITTFGMALHLW